MPATQNIPQVSQSEGMTNIFISFIVTAYNIPAKMLRQCIDSILKLPLSHEQREVIVVDDGSEIPAINCLKDIAEDIIYIRQQNKGLSEARNTGMEHASGLYIQFVDGDDCLLPKQYCRCLDLLRNNTSIDMLMFCHTSNINSHSTAGFNGPTTGTKHMLLNNLRGSAWGYIFRRTMALGLRFTAGIYHEDEEFTPLLTLRAKCLYTTSTKAYYYRQRRSSIMHSHEKLHNDKRLGDMLIVIRRLQRAQKKLAPKEREALGRRIDQLSMDYLYNVIVLTKSRKKLKKAKTSLADSGLYPLPNKRYTLKYSLFRKLL